MGGVRSRRRGVVGAAAIVRRCFYFLAPVLRLSPGSEAQGVRATSVRNAQVVLEPMGGVLGEARSSSAAGV